MNGKVEESASRIPYEPFAWRSWPHERRTRAGTICVVAFLWGAGMIYGAEVVWILHLPKSLSYAVLAVGAAAMTAVPAALTWLRRSFAWGAVTLLIGAYMIGLGTHWHPVSGIRF